MHPGHRHRPAIHRFDARPGCRRHHARHRWQGSQRPACPESGSTRLGARVEMAIRQQGVYAGLRQSVHHARGEFLHHEHVHLVPLNGTYDRGGIGRTSKDVQAENPKRQRTRPGTRHLGHRGGLPASAPGRRQLPRQESESRDREQQGEPPGCGRCDRHPGERDQRRQRGQRREPGIGIGGLAAGRPGRQRRNGHRGEDNSEDPTHACPPSVRRNGDQGTRSSRVIRSRWPGGLWASIRCGWISLGCGTDLYLDGFEPLRMSGGRVLSHPRRS
jgi:hypothetical protein